MTEKKTRLALVDEHGKLVPVKSAYIPFRCTDSERAEFEAEAGKLGLNLSEYIRWLHHNHAHKPVRKSRRK